MVRWLIQAKLGWVGRIVINMAASSNNVEATDDGGIIIYGNNSDDLESFDGRYNWPGHPDGANRRPAFR